MKIIAALLVIGGAVVGIIGCCIKVGSDGQWYEERQEEDFS